MTGKAGLACNMIWILYGSGRWLHRVDSEKVFDRNLEWVEALGVTGDVGSILVENGAVKFSMIWIDDEEGDLRGRGRGRPV